jgi:hypothetical protein
MWQSPCMPCTVTNVLCKCKPLLNCAQGVTSGCCVGCGAPCSSTRAEAPHGMVSIAAPQYSYWTLRPLVRSGQWDADILVARMAHDILRS